MSTNMFNIFFKKFYRFFKSAAILGTASIAGCTTDPPPVTADGGIDSIGLNTDSSRSTRTEM